MNDEHLILLEGSASAFARVRRERSVGERAARSGFDRDVWSQIAEQGWLSILVPEDAGGLGLGILSITVVARALGQAAERSPFVAVGAMAALCLSEADDPSAVAGILGALGEGGSTVSLAWQGERGDIDVGSCDVLARTERTGFRLSGASRFAALPSADAFIVAARGDAGLSLYLVPAGAPGLAVVPEPCADGSELALLRLDDVKLDAGACLVAPGTAEVVLRRTIDAGLIASAAELVGTMDSVLDMTLDYLRTRRQFDVPIGSFQALRHRAVDIWMQRELSAVAVNAAARRFDDPETSTDERSASASGAKSRAASAAMLLCNQALQLHGAMGFTEEYGLGVYLNRALTLAAWLGNAAQHRTRFAAFSPAPGLGTH